MQEDWKEYILTEFVEINPPVQLEKDSEYSFVEMKDLNENKRFVYPSTIRKLTSGSRFENNDTLFARITPCLENGKICQVKGLKNGVGFGSTEFLVFRGRRNVSDNDFVFYLSRYSEVKEFGVQNMSGTSGRQRVNKEAFNNLFMELPPHTEQQKIASILSSLDDKIELNNKMNQTLEKIASAIFNHWFIDFEFPNEEGKPYKSSIGEMVSSELGEIPKGWRVGNLRDIYLNFDFKRIPLSSREREIRKGTYPYYGAASILDYVDDYIFDGIYLLLGEDGTVIDENEKPILQYVWGKFWVNNHTHVMQGKKYFTTEYLYLLLKNTNVKHIITGAVQPKISQMNLNNIKVIMPTNDILELFSSSTKTIFEEIRIKKEENQTLHQLRESLLPRLMNGKIRVKLDA